MTYLSDRKKSRLQYKYYIVVVLVLGVIVYFWTGIRSALLPYSEPVAVKYGLSKSYTKAAPSSFFTFFSSKYTLASKNKELELSVERLENELALRNSKLRELYSIESNSISTSTRVIVMYPLLEDITSVYSTVLLSKGFKDGVTVDMVVYIRGRQPVCVIKEVYTSTSLCKLFSAYGESIEGVLGDVTLYVKGDGGGTYLADIPRGTVITDGDPVYLKRDQSMVLGNVVSVTRDDQAAFWKVYIRGAYNPTNSHIFYTNQ